MNDDDLFKLPRLYIDAPIQKDRVVPLSADQAHYFKTVLRRQDGDNVRIFNGRDGEFLCVLQEMTKKGGTAFAERQTREQPADSSAVHLFFAPIKKSRMDWLVEKAIELGATDLHPVVTQNTEVRELNTKRLMQQMQEAAEQCERLDLPVLHDLIKLNTLAAQAPKDTVLLAALERGDTQPVTDVIRPGQSIAILIGPEGGFTAQESTWIQTQSGWVPVSLGPRILRSETAACVALTAVMLKGRSDNDGNH
ncbi:MAG: methyltransferase family protein [Micavibrio sp.]|nr:methyltransferase family protein [Micavibrio sp.]